jgi:hypothetical protein
MRVVPHRVGVPQPSLKELDIAEVVGVYICIFGDGWSYGLPNVPRLGVEDHGGGDSSRKADAFSKLCILVAFKDIRESDSNVWNEHSCLGDTRTFGVAAVSVDI